MLRVLNPEVEETNDFLGWDVVVYAKVAPLAGNPSRSLRPLQDRARLKHAEQRRHGHPRSSAQLTCKQFFDRQARHIVMVAAHVRKVVVLESLKTFG